MERAAAKGTTVFQVRHILGKFGIAFLIGALLITAAPAIDVDAAAIAKLAVKQGSIGDGQIVDALAVQDNAGNDDNYAGYVEFIPDAQKHRSILTLPGDGLDALDSVTAQWNYRGPQWATVRWKVHVKNQQTKQWELVFENRTTPGWTWVDGEHELTNPGRYVRADGKVVFRILSNNANDVGQFDEFRLVTDSDPEPPSDFPVNVPFDYQIGEAYDLPAGVGAVSRDWFDSDPADDAYNVCYVNGFQTQDDSSFVDRPDERSNWPANLVLSALGDDPNWGGEYLIDISTSAKRNAARDWLTPMIQTCADKGYDAVEFDNLDSWTRFDGTPVASQVPFDRDDAITFATMITTVAHDAGLLSAQKNTADITAVESASIGFDFAVVESCGRFNECDVFQAIYGNRIFAIEYGDGAFASACAAVGDDISVVRRNRAVSAPTFRWYRFAEC